MIHFFQILGAGILVLGESAPDAAVFHHQPPLGRVGKGDDGASPDSAVSRSSMASFRPRRGEEGGGGIDAAEAAEADASFFIFPQHLQDHVVRGGVVSPPYRRSEGTDGGAPFFRDPRDLRIVRGNHHPRQRRRIPGRPGWNRKEWGGRRNRRMFLWGMRLLPPRAVMMATAFLAGCLFHGCHFRRCLLRRYRLRKYRSVCAFRFRHISDLAFLPRSAAVLLLCMKITNLMIQDQKGKGKSARGRRIRAQAPDQSASRARAIRCCAPFPSTAACMERASASRFSPVFRQRKKQGRKRFDDLLFLSGVTGAGNPREALHVPGAGKLVVRQGETDRRHACAQSSYRVVPAADTARSQPSMREAMSFTFSCSCSRDSLAARAASSCLCACMGPVRAWILQEALGGAWRRKEASRPATLQASVPPVEIRRLPTRSRNAGASPGKLAAKGRVLPSQQRPARLRIKIPGRQENHS